jgi:hypothetical protein
MFLDKVFGLFLGLEKPARLFSCFRIRSGHTYAPVISWAIKPGSHVRLLLIRYCCRLLSKKQSKLADLGTFVRDREYLKQTVERVVNPLLRPIRRDESIGDPNGIRTRVTAVKGRCPGPLDDRVVQGERNMTVRARCAREKCAGTWSPRRSGKLKLPRRRAVNSATPGS